MDAKKNNSTARRPGLHLIISPAQVLALAMIEEAPPTLVEIANRVADRYGYERLDEAMEAVD